MNPGYEIRKIYLKAASVEVPRMRSLPAAALRPDISVSARIDGRPFPPAELECSLEMTLHAALAGVPMFHIEITLSGLFSLNQRDPASMDTFTRDVAPLVLFPYARRELTLLTIDAGFQPIAIDPREFARMLRRDTADASATAPGVTGGATAPDESRTSPRATPPQPSDASRPAVSPSDTAPPLRRPARLAYRPAAMIALSIALMTAAGIAVDRWITRRNLEKEIAVVRAQHQAYADALIKLSRLRLTEQNPAHHTVPLGTFAAENLSRTLQQHAGDRPVYVLAASPGNVELYYGVFPSTDSAVSESTAELNVVLGKDRLRLTPRSIADVLSATTPR